PDALELTVVGQSRGDGLGCSPVIQRTTWLEEVVVRGRNGRSSPTTSTATSRASSRPCARRCSRAATTTCTSPTSRPISSDRTIAQYAADIWHASRARWHDGARDDPRHEG